ncbi:MAG: endonuclease III [Planctomycetes bacterium]|nr:endonuclease III [Planctomycetota bacterium]
MAKTQKKAAKLAQAKPAPVRAERGAPHEWLALLARAVPAARCELDFANAWELLVATILSAQSTDARVNLVTPALFARFATPAALGAAAQAEVEELVKSTGFFRNKARAIREASAEVAARFGGEVPCDMEALMTLRGVARKTANLVLGAACGVASGIVVDTHAARVAQRLGLTAHADPEKIERELCAFVPREQWIATGLRLVLHGRYTCTAKKPQCAGCALRECCPSRDTSG